MSIRELVSPTTAMVGVLVLVASAAGDVTSNNPAVQIFSQELVTFKGGNEYVAQATIVQKSFDDLDPIDAQIRWKDDSLDITGPVTGLRWFERIYNDTDYAWTNYSFELSGNKDAFFVQNGAFSSSEPGPNQALSDFDAQGHGGDPNDYVTSIVLTGGQPQVSDDHLSLWFDFDQPILPGGYLEIYVPILGLDNAGGSFNLSQMPVIPAPPAVLLGCLGLGLVGCLKRRFG